MTRLPAITVASIGQLRAYRGFGLDRLLPTRQPAYHLLAYHLLA